MEVHLLLFVEDHLLPGAMPQSSMLASQTQSAFTHGLSKKLDHVSHQHHHHHHNNNHHRMFDMRHFRHGHGPVVFSAIM